MEIALQCGLLTLELGASLATVICRVHEQGPLCLLTYNSTRANTKTEGGQCTRGYAIDV